MKSHTGVLFPLLFLALLSSCNLGGTSTITDEALAAAPDAVAADPGHYTILFENDVARFLRIKYPPGATSVMHKHPAICAIFVSPQKMTFATPSGADATLVEYAAGEVICNDATIHLPENVADQETDFVLLELKNRKTFDNALSGKPLTVSSQPELPDAATADPSHYSVLFENDVVRLLRIKLGPGERSVMHVHPASCGVALVSGSYKMTAQDGKTSTSKEDKGAFSCTDVEGHLPENVGDMVAEIIQVEFKNRQTIK